MYQMYQMYQGDSQHLGKLLNWNCCGRISCREFHVDSTAVDEQQTCGKYVKIRWMEEILNQLIGELGFNYSGLCRISSIHSMSSKTGKWRFPEIGVPLVPWSSSILRRFSTINHYKPTIFWGSPVSGTPQMSFWLARSWRTGCPHLTNARAPTAMTRSQICRAAQAIGFRPRTHNDLPEEPELDGENRTQSSVISEV